MIHKQKVSKKIFLCISLIFLKIISGCSSEPTYIIFKTDDRDQLKERSIKYCYGDFKVLEEEEIGPYTRAHLECKE